MALGQQDAALIWINAVRGPESAKPIAIGGDGLCP
jgi:hypothetical protein